MTEHLPHTLCWWLIVCTIHSRCQHNVSTLNPCTALIVQHKISIVQHLLNAVLIVQHKISMVQYLLNAVLIVQHLPHTSLLNRSIHPLQLCNWFSTYSQRCLLTVQYLPWRLCRVSKVHYLPPIPKYMHHITDISAGAIRCPEGPCSHDFYHDVR